MRTPPCRCRWVGVYTVAIQLDTGTFQGSVFSPFLFDLFINTLLLLLDSSRTSHKAKNPPDWNHQAFADDLSLYMEDTADADTLLKLVQKFQDWSELKISTKQSIVTGTLYGREARRGKTMANAKACREKARTAKRRGLAVACEWDNAFMLDEQGLQVEGAVRLIQGKAMKVMIKTCGIVKENYHFHSTDSDRCCRQCATTWSPKDIKYEGVRLKTIPERREEKPKNSWFPPNMWLYSSAQRRKFIDGAVEVASYLRKNETLRID